MWDVGEGSERSEIDEITRGGTGCGMIVVVDEDRIAFPGALQRRIHTDGHEWNCRASQAVPGLVFSRSRCDDPVWRGIFCGKHLPELAFTLKNVNIPVVRWSNRIEHADQSIPLRGEVQKEHNGDFHGADGNIC